MILDRQQHESVRVVLEERLWLNFLSRLLSCNTAHLGCCSDSSGWNNLAICSTEASIVLIEELRAAGSLRGSSSLRLREFLRHRQVLLVGQELRDLSLDSVPLGLALL